MMLTEYNEKETMELFKKEYLEEGRQEERAAFAAEKATYLSRIAELEARLAIKSL